MSRAVALLLCVVHLIQLLQTTLSLADDVMDYGCYRDNSWDRDLESTVMRWREDNTVDKCIAHCKSQNYKYAGLQNGYACICGNSFGKHGALDNSKCDTPCAGNEDTLCGGELANRIYGTERVYDECKCEVCSDVILRRDRVLKDTAGVIDKTTLRTQEHYASAKVNLKVITSVAFQQTVRGSSCTTGLTHRRDGVWVDLRCHADELRVCGIPHNTDKDCIEFDGSWNCYSYAKPRSSENCDPGCADDEFCNRDIRGLWSCKQRPIDPIHPDTLWSVNVTTMYCPLSNPDSCQHPGTTGKVWIKILGARKNTGWFELKPKSGEFEEGFTDEFHFKTPNIGRYRHIYIEHEAVEQDDVWGCKEVTVRKNLDKPLKFRCSWIHGQSRRLPFPGGEGVNRRRSGTVNMSTILRNFAMKHNCCWHNGVCGRCERSIKSQDAAALFDVDVDDHRGLWFGN